LVVRALQLADLSLDLFATRALEVHDAVKKKEGGERV